MSHTHSVAVFFWSVYLHVVISRRCEIVWDVADGSFYLWGLMEMICLWMNNWTNIDISFLCPVTVELQALHLSKYLTDATRAVCLCGYLVLSHKVNWGLWGSLIEILQARFVYIHRDTPRSRLAYKLHAVIIQLYPHSASSLARQPSMVQMHHRMCLAWAKSLFFHPATGSWLYQKRAGSLW